MNRQELVDILNALELKYPVNKWTYNGIKVWPIIKLQIYFYYINNFIEKGVVSEPKKKTIGKRVSDVFYSLFHVIVLLLKPSEKGDWIITAEDEAYKTIYNGEKINKFYYPLKTSIEQAGYKTLTLNRTSLPKKSDFPIKNDTIFISQYYPFFRFWNKLNSFVRKPKIDFPSYKEVIENIEKSIPFKSPFQEGKEKKYLCVKPEQVFAYINSLKIIINKYSPKFIFELCYYVPSNLAINILANKRKIPIIEIQHGSIGASHLAYYGWINFPINGYKVFPNKIWCWDINTYDLIKTWVSKTIGIELILGGNPWLTYINNLELKEVKEFFDGKNVIIYTMQRNYIEDYIYETIKLSSEKFTWMLRPHPSRMYAIDEIKRKAHQYNIESKIETDKAQEFPLPSILKHSILHLSEFSGSIIEAALLGKHSIILNQIGVDSYTRYIEEGLATAFLSKDAQGLVELIDNFDLSKSVTNEKSFEYDEILKNIISN